MDQTCPKCGSPLSEGNIGNLCPKCVAATILGGTTRYIGDYEILEEIGRGGMGVVYKARHANLQRIVALKILPEHLAENDSFVARFQREARTLAKLNHPGIVMVYDLGRTDDGQLYFAMEYVEGTNLRQIMRQPGLDPDQALAIISEICDGLQAAHREGVIHRDIKPENILITTAGHAKLADFGLARPEKDEAISLTATNAVLGTPDYMSPEQRNGEEDERTDVFSLGVVFYEMLTGRAPRGAFDPPSCDVQVDVRLDEVVLKALQQKPDRRYQHVDELKTDVDRIRTTSSDKEKAPVRWPKNLAIGAMGVVVVFLLALWLFPRLAKDQVGGESVENEFVTVDYTVVQMVTNAMTGKVYGLVRSDPPVQGLTWNEAEQVANELGGHLVSANSPEEYQWLLRAFTVDSRFDRHIWIGLSDAEETGVFAWSNGDLLDFENWYPGEPDGSQNGEGFALISNFPKNHLWTDKGNVPRIGEYPVSAIAELN